MDRSNQVNRRGVIAEVSSQRCHRRGVIAEVSRLGRIRLALL